MSVPPLPTPPNRTAVQSPDQIRTHVTHGLARLVLATFVFTFIAARLLVILIMAHKLPPQLFFHVSGAHVHHLNYGIAILSVTGAFLLFARPGGKPLSFAAILYGIGLALTFDEFGMWVHLGGPYWQRASYDAVIIVAAALALVAYGSTIRHWRPRHHFTIVLLVLAIAGFGLALYNSVQWAGNRIGPLLEQLEQQGPS